MESQKLVIAFSVIILNFLCCCSSSAQDSIPSQNLINSPYVVALKAPVKTWDEAVPLGNGLTGGLLWGTDNTINLSLDRGDLWDERLPGLYHKDNWNYDTIRKLKAEGNQKEISRLFDTPYKKPYPTKLPGGRLVISLDSGLRAVSFDLDMRRAVGSVNLGKGKLECFFSAVQPVAMIRAPGPKLTYKFVRPGGLNKLGYEPARVGEDDGMTWMTQKAALGLEYAIVVASKRTGKHTQLAVAIASNRDCDDPLAIGRKRVTDALDKGYDALLVPHLEWWEKFWKTSSVSVPNQRIQRHYNLVKYFYGAASRPDAPPIPLQGVWTRDDGNLPPWKGDFHHDLNTQMTYLPYHTAGLLDAGRSFVNYNWNLLPVYRKFAREFYGVEGAAMPGVATLGGKPTGGWAQYSLSPVNALWVGQSFYLHWRYTMDRKFLEERAYPWLAEIATGIVNLMTEKDGKLYLPLSSSPEIHNNSLRAWLAPNSNYDLSLIQWAFEALEEMAEALGNDGDAGKWRSLRGKLNDLHVDDQNVLMFAKREPFNGSHRHHSHTMAIHPLGTLNVEGSARDRSVINATIDRINAKGTQAWTGYSFSWFSCILARVGRAEEALKHLVDYERAFILRNGFHVNGDQIGTGLTRWKGRPFTLEGNFLAMEAVHEMLLQSWGGRVRLFPAVSKQWKDVSFENLCSQDGFKVSGKYSNGIVQSTSITTTVDQVLRLRNPFKGKFKTNIKYSTKDDDILCDLRSGQTLELTAED